MRLVAIVEFDHHLTSGFILGGHRRAELVAKGLCPGCFGLEIYRKQLKTADFKLISSWFSMVFL